MMKVISIVLVASFLFGSVYVTANAAVPPGAGVCLNTLLVVRHMILQDNSCLDYRIMNYFKQVARVASGKTLVRKAKNIYTAGNYIVGKFDVNSYTLSMFLEYKIQNLDETTIHSTEQYIVNTISKLGFHKITEKGLAFMYVATYRVYLFDYALLIYLARNRQTIGVAVLSMTPH